jgi:hypothetical protein
VKNCELENLMNEKISASNQMPLSISTQEKTKATHLKLVVDERTSISGMN